MPKKSSPSLWKVNLNDTSTRKGEYSAGSPFSARKGDRPQYSATNVEQFLTQDVKAKASELQRRLRTVLLKPIGRMTRGTFVNDGIQLCNRGIQHTAQQMNLLPPDEQRKALYLISLYQTYFCHFVMLAIESNCDVMTIQQGIPNTKQQNQQLIQTFWKDIFRNFKAGRFDSDPEGLLNHLEQLQPLMDRTGLANQYGWLSKKIIEAKFKFATAQAQAPAAEQAARKFGMQP